ncbi:MAG TPA: hypothetical protein EYG20_02775 [Alcanivorax sp.]|nr:hypothetical protein [Alcanivorax sp.]
MPEQVTGDDSSWLDSLGSWIGQKVDQAADLGLEVIRSERLPGDNASANPDTAPVVTTGTGPTGEPVYPTVDSLMRNWPMILAAVVVVLALILLLWRMF